MAATTAETAEISPAPVLEEPEDKATSRGQPARPVLVHEPALDGLRGLAVAAVFAFHLGWIDGGFLGVDLFFALSGFLITSLLLLEHRNHGKINLPRFWARRARRLLPALGLLLVGVAAMMLLFVESGWRPRYRGDALATLGYVANWHRMLDDLGYWDIFNEPSPLDHAWSLAIEEQFYLFWPLTVMAVAWLVVRRRSSHATPAVGAVALVGGISSLVLLAVLYAPNDTNRAYFGTDARLGPILLGAALAAFVAERPRRTARPSWRLELAGVLAMAWLVWSLVTVDGLDSWYYRGGLALFAVAAAVVMAATTGGPPGRLSSLLAWKPLAALGLISYGVYLWHWPIVVYLDAERVEQDLHVTPPDWAIDLARIAVTLAISLASYKLLEQPIRHGALKGRQLLVAAPAALGAVLAIILVTTAGTATSQLVEIEQRALEGSDNPQHLYPADIPPDAQRILLVGDSGPYYLGPALVAEAEETGGAVVASWSELRRGCGLIAPEGATLLPEGEVLEDEPCHENRRRSLRDLATVFEPDVIIWYMANAGGIGRYRLDGEWLDECDPAYDRYFREAVARDVEALRPDGSGAAPTPVMLATTPYVGNIADVEGSRARVDCRNETYGDLATELEASEVVDMNGFMQDEADGDEAKWAELFRDPVHLSDHGATLVSRWLLTEIQKRA